jgi:hypothetical protein
MINTRNKVETEKKQTLVIKSEVTRVFFLRNVRKSNTCIVGFSPLSATAASLFPGPDVYAVIQSEISEDCKNLCLLSFKLYKMRQ